MPERTNSADAQARYEDAAGVLMAISIVTRKLARKLLRLTLGEDEELRRELEARGVEPNGAGALLYAQWKRAVNGDLKAAAFLRDLAGTEEPKKKAAPIDLRAMSDEELLALAGEAPR